MLLALLAGLSWLSDRTTDLALPVLTDVVLYPLLAVDVVLLLTLCFVLARNLLKLWVEQRQAAPFGRFRVKLVAALLAMSIIPAVLVLLSGSSIITNSTALWFNEPVSDVLSAAQTIASRWYGDHQEMIALRAETLAGRLPAADVASGNDTALDAMVRTELSTLRDGMIEVYRAVSDPGRSTDVALVTAVESPTLARDTVRASTASADRIASRVVMSGDEDRDRGSARVGRGARQVGVADPRRRQACRRCRRRLAPPAGADPRRSSARDHGLPAVPVALHPPRAAAWASSCRSS